MAAGRVRRRTQEKETWILVRDSRGELYLRCKFCGAIVHPSKAFSHSCKDLTPPGSTV